MALGKERIKLTVQLALMHTFLYKLLFPPFFPNINEHSARVGGDVRRVWMEYADK